MDLISCKNCGVVLDKSRNIFPDLDIETITDGNAEWDGDGYVPKMKCPVCGETILNDN